MTLFSHIVRRLAGLFDRACTEPAVLRARTYRDQPRPDGTPRYDDVWGS